MGKTSIIILEHEKQSENRSKLDMIRFPVPLLFTILLHRRLVED